jgi:hypothetical protein
VGRIIAMHVPGQGACVTTAKPKLAVGGHPL